MRGHIEITTSDERIQRKERKKAMKILVTGGMGFIGSHLVEEFLQNGHAVRSLDIKNKKIDSIDVCYNRLVDFFEFFDPDVVCHLAAIPSVQKSIIDPLATMKNNILGTWNVLETARKIKVKRVVFASSGAVYGETAFKFSGEALHEKMSLEPLSPYGLSKKFGEEMVRMWADKKIWENAPDTVSLRFSNVFGPRQPRDAAYASCIERFMHQWRNGEPFTVVPDGHQRRDMVFVADVVRAIRLACEGKKDFNGEAINIGSGKNYSILEIANLIGGKDYPRVFIETRVGEIRETLFNISLAKSTLNWQPEVSFEEGIEVLKKEQKS